MAKDDSSILNQLGELIEKERQALLTGELESLAQILERKEALIETLKGQQPGNLSELEAVQAGMDRNQVLFDHALAGIRTVANRLGALRKLRRSLDTYDSLGRKTEIAGTPAKRLERRA